MDEWLPAVLGCTWGLLAVARRRAPATLAPGAIAIGVLVPLANGELAASPWYAVVDTASAAAGTAAAVAAWAAARALARAAPRRRSG